MDEKKRVVMLDLEDCNDPHPLMLTESQIRLLEWLIKEGMSMHFNYLKIGDIQQI